MKLAHFLDWFKKRRKPSTEFHIRKSILAGMLELSEDGRIVFDVKDYCVRLVALGDNTISVWHQELSPVDVRDFQGLVQVNLGNLTFHLSHPFCENVNVKITCDGVRVDHRCFAPAEPVDCVGKFSRQSDCCWAQVIFDVEPFSRFLKALKCFSDSPCEYPEPDINMFQVWRDDSSQTLVVTIKLCPSFYGFILPRACYNECDALLDMPPGWLFDD